MAWKPSYDSYRSTEVSIRIMNIYDFVNSKTLFRTMRCRADQQLELLAVAGPEAGQPLTLLA